jgi:SagB-type dehydrogenase family enzyme
MAGEGRSSAVHPGRAEPARYSRRWALAVGAATIGVLASGACSSGGPSRAREAAPATTIPLQVPVTSGGVALSDVLARRRSRRDFTGRPMTGAELSQLLWAAQGVTADWGGRTAPSAGALYPIEVFVVAGAVEGLDQGSFRYDAAGHRLVPVAAGDRRAALAAAALGQDMIAEAPADLVVAGVVARTAARYGDRAERYVHLEAGHVAQNVLLQAVALDLGSVPVGAFDDAQVSRALDLPSGTKPLYVLPVGQPAR